MNPTNLELVYLGLLISTSFLLIIAITINAKQLGLLLCFVILMLNNTAVITTFFKEINIPGSPILFLILILISTFVLYPLNLSKIPSHLLSKEGLLLLLCLIFIGVSVVVSIDRIASLKALLYFSIMFIYGWVIVGKIITKYDEPRNIMIKFADVFGILSVIFTILTLIIAGPVVHKYQYGGGESLINLFGITTHRLQARGLNAPIVGVSSAIAFFWLYAAFQRFSKNFIRKFLLITLLLFSFFALLWSASRRAIIAFFATWVIIAFIDQKGKKMSISKYFRVIIIVAFAIYFFSFHFIGILYRGSGTNAINQSLFSLFLDSRVNIHGEDISNLLAPTLLGQGYGVVPTIDDGGLILESFFLKMYVELGVIGGIMYLMTFIVLTLSVVKVDRFYAALGERGALFPSTIMIFTWMNSISSWGFSLPVGTLAIQLSIVSVAVYIWRKRINTFKINNENYVKGVSHNGLS